MRVRLSASGLWRAKKCPASTVLPAVRRVHADAIAGTEAHAVLEKSPPPGGLAEVAFALDPETGKAREIGRGIGRGYYEAGLLDTEIPGTADLIIPGEPVVVRDYKTGHGYMVSAPRDNLQLGHNAVCASRVFGASEAVIEVEHTQTGEVESVLLDSMDLSERAAEIREVWREAYRARAALARGDTPRIVEGDHCWRCEAFAHCPAKLGLALTLSTGEIAKVLPTTELTAQAVAEGWSRLKAAKKLLGEVEGIYRGFAAGQPVSLGGRRMLGMVSKPVDHLDGEVAFKVLRERHGDAIASAAVEMSTSKAALERALGPIAPQRGKAAMVRATVDAIRDAGGVKTNWTQKIEEFNEGEEIK